MKNYKSNGWIDNFMRISVFCISPGFTALDSSEIEMSMKVKNVD